MPSSDTSVIPIIIEGVRDLIRAGKTPKSVLDVGCGFGKYGFLLREYLEVCYGRYKPEQWKVRIDAIEAFIPFLTGFHEVLYNNVYKGTLNTLHNELDSYDIVLAVDVIEHLEKKDGWAFLNQLKSIYKKQLYISTPAKFRGINCMYSNWDYGQHRSFWSAEDFDKSEPLFNDGWMSVYRYQGDSK